MTRERARRCEGNSGMAEAFDVIVVGGGNAAFCAALAAQEQGAKVLMLEARAGGRVGRQQPLHRGLDARGLQRRRRHQDAGARPHRAGDRRDRLRHLHGRPVLRRHGAGDAEPRRSRPGRAAGHQELRHVLLAARQGHPLHPDLRPAGVQDRRQVQVLGRADGRGGRRRAGPGQDGDRGGAEARHRDPLRDPGAEPAVRRRARQRRARPPRRRRERHPRQGGGARLRRLRGQRRMAHPLSRSGLGPRQGARHPLQHRRRHPHGARHRRDAATATGRAATPCSGR